MGHIQNTLVFIKVLLNYNYNSTGAQLKLQHVMINKNIILLLYATIT